MLPIPGKPAPTPSKTLVKTLEVRVQEGLGYVIDIEMQDGNKFQLDAVDDGGLVILTPGGRLALSTLKAKAPTPQEVAANPSLYKVWGNNYDITSWGISMNVYYNPETDDVEITGVYRTWGEWFEATKGTNHSGPLSYMKMILGAPVNTANFDDDQKRRLGLMR